VAAMLAMRVGHWLGCACGMANRLADNLRNGAREVTQIERTTV